MKCTVWGRYKNKEAEIIDTAKNPKEAQFMVGEYRMAFGSGWVIWYDEPHTVSEPKDKIQ